MAKECSHHHCSHIYHATAFGVSGELLRPAQRSIPSQATTTLAPGGGRGFDRVENIQFDGIISFRSASAEVGGSFDACHNLHTSYAYSMIEGLNIAGMLTADKVVSRLAVYSPEEGSDEESSFDITGSYFENLRIAGHQVDVKLATHEFHKHDTYSKFEQALQAKKADHLLFLSGLSELSAKQLQNLEGKYHALHGISERVAGWKRSTSKNRAGTGYLCSAAGHLDLKQHVGANSEIQGFGPIICIPKFGIVRLAEMVIHKERRQLNMLRVEMCSTGTGTVHGGGSGGGSGGTTYP
jgi:hypothetical protein